jgi:Integral peroxisomal membrane peroxin
MQAVHLNVTGLLLRDFSELQADLLRDRSGVSTTGYGILHPSALSTVGLRRASENSSVIVHNKSGIDIEIAVGSEDYLIANETICTIGKTEGDDISVSLRVTTSSAGLIGEREPVNGLAISRRGNSAVVHLLKSVLPSPSLQSGESGLSRCIEGRSSPESMLTDLTAALDWGYYNAEPVVEWCMQNQRIAPGVSDLFSLTKGKDILSNIVWSPEDDLHLENHNLDPYSFGNNAERELLSISQLDSPEQKKTSLQVQSQRRTNWLRPYLSEDPPEWTDMTCMLRMARERLMLPDNRWMWLNEWTVDLHGKLGLDTDADGWQYAMDFEAFSNTKCSYERGAACRRRRWTRTVSI